MGAIACVGVAYMPVVSNGVKTEVSIDLIELAPAVHRALEAAFAPMPSFVIQDPQPVSRAVGKRDLTDVAGPILRELKTVHAESQDKIVPVPFGRRRRIIRVGVPSVIQLFE